MLVLRRQIELEQFLLNSLALYIHSYMLHKHQIACLGVTPGAEWMFDAPRTQHAIDMAHTGINC